MYYSNPDNVENEMLKYLNERYEEEFESVYMAEPSFAYNYYRMTAYPKDNKDNTFEVEAHKYGNSKFHYFDSYYGIKITKEYEEYVKSLIKKYFKIFKCYMDYSKKIFPEDFDVNLTFSESLSYDYQSHFAYPYIDICIPSYLYDKTIINNMVEELARQKIRGSIYIASFNESAYNLINEYDWNEVVQDDDYSFDIFFIDNKYEIY